MLTLGWLAMVAAEAPKPANRAIRITAATGEHFDMEEPKIPEVKVSLLTGGRELLRFCLSFSAATQCFILG